MLKLISLEIRKHKLAGMLKAVLYANLGLLIFMVLVLFMDQSEVDRTFESYAELLDGLFVFVKSVFIIFGAVLLGKLIIDEYRNNTITLLFMYPIPRKKLMAAKVIVVFLFTMVTIIVSYLILAALLVGLDAISGIIPGQLTLSLVGSTLAKLGFGALYAAGISLIPLYIGMRKKSLSATIVSSVLIVSLISSGFEQFRLGDLAYVSIALCLLGIAIAYLSIRKVETEDIS
ncbi:ABC transporter permease [Paenibacillus sp. sgz500958]|uniref:ABC transporter permease n=1 Tax=Paenibacillus sp. sgz500958 TaxID=3242475 RepID=UPI0036D24417